jgi:hypothetical protein
MLPAVATTPTPTAQRSRAWLSGPQLLGGLLTVVGLSAIGAALGVVWRWWAPARPYGVVLAPHAIAAGESESFIAGDGRYALLTGVVGLVFGIAAWWARSARGPVMAASLAVGGLAGAGFTALLGHKLGGGTTTGAVNTEIMHLPLSVHARGLVFTEALLAVLGYAICAAFASRDDLGVTVDR